MSLKVENLTKTFDGISAISEVSLTVPENAFCCVVGPSGCGKSTLLRLIAGLETPDQGSITLNGTPVVGPGLFVPPEQRQIGVVFQSYALWPHLTVEKNVAFPYEAQGVGAAEAKRRAAPHLQTVSLESYADRRPESLSGGQRQRVALARCLASDAQTILMDEPLANLDPHLRATMESELRTFHEQSNVTTLYITHDQREAMALADIMAVLDAGRILQVGTPEEVYEHPQSETVARFIGRGTVLSADVTARQATIGGRRVSLDGSGEGSRQIFVRPKNIIVSEEGWPAEISSVHYRGGLWEATALSSEVDGPIMLDLHQPVRSGDTLQLSFTGGWILPS
ncbi:MAG: ABC transporter ATP-binding protein [Pseudomonadota bacterium]